VNSFVYNVKREPARRGRLFGTALILSFLAGAIASSIGIALLPLLLQDYARETVRTAQGLMLMSPIILVALMMQTGAEAAADFRGANASRGVSVAGTFVGCACLLLTGTLSPLTAALAYLLPQIPLTIWLFNRLTPHYRPGISRFRSSALRLLRYGLRCFPAEFVTAASGYVGQATVIALVQPAAVGYFIVSLSISKLLEIFYTAVASVLLPATAARSLEDVVDKTARAARVTFVLMASAGLALIVVLPIALPLVYGHDFAEAVPIARLLILEAVLSGTVWVLVQAFFSLGRPELATLCQVVTLAASVILLLVFVPKYGAVGAAQVLLGVAIAKLTLALGLYRYALGVPVRGLAYSRADVAYVGALLRR